MSALANMKRKQLEMMLERLEGFSRPSFQREQYATPASVAAEMLFLAGMRGELGTVCDLGCGTGVLAIGAALLGAVAAGCYADLETAAAAMVHLGRTIEPSGIHAAAYTAGYARYCALYERLAPLFV